MPFLRETCRWANSAAKIVHIYDLEYAVEYGCEYRLRGEEAEEA